MGPGLPHGSSPSAEGPRDDNPKGSRLGARDTSNPSSHVTFWSALIATGPLYGGMVHTGLDWHSEAARSWGQGPGQAILIFMIILTPVVLIAAFRSLILWASGKWIRTDGILTTAGVLLIVFPYILGSIMD